MTADPDTYKKLKEMPAGANSIEWPIEQTRAAEAAARIFWPLGNTKLERRLPLIKSPTLLLWGEKDRLIPRSYAAAIAKAMKAKTETKIIPARGIWPSSTSPTRSPPPSSRSCAERLLACHVRHDDGLRRFGVRRRSLRESGRAENVCERPPRENSSAKRASAAGHLAPPCSTSKLSSRVVRDLRRAATVAHIGTNPYRAARRRLIRSYRASGLRTAAG